LHLAQVQVRFERLKRVFQKNLLDVLSKGVNKEADEQRFAQSRRLFHHPQAFSTLTAESKTGVEKTPVL